MPRRAERLSAAPRRAGGFGLLEAIVALTLLAGAGMALFSWINVNLAQASRLQEVEAAIRAQNVALEWVEILNPALSPEGETELDKDLRIAWQSRPLTPRTMVAPFPGGTHTPFELALFEVTVRVQAPGLAREHEWSFRRLGVWREPVQQVIQEIRK